MKSRVLFLAAVLVSLPMPVLADEVGFPGGTVNRSGISSGAAAVPNGLPSAILFNGALTSAHAKPPRGNSLSVFGTSVEDRLDASSQRSLSSIVKIDDGAISISVPEPGTMGTLSIGLAMMIAGLTWGKPRNLKSFLH